MNKSDGIEIMKKCAGVGDKIFTKVCTQLKKPSASRSIKTELDLANFIKNEIHKSGGVESFPVIVTSGPQAGNDIHPIPTDAKLAGFVIIDFGVKMQGYCSDMTRTVFIGKPTKTQIDLYNVLLNAQNGSIRYFKAGFPASAPDAYVRGFLANSNLEVGLPSKTLDQYFIHTLGHGISKKVHEKPSIFFKSKDVFKLGQMVTSEPGIYIPNTLGIRIEDMYLITDDKPIQITKSKKDLLVF